MMKLIYKDKYIFEVDSNSLIEAISYIKQGRKDKFKILNEDRNIIKDILYAQIKIEYFKLVVDSLEHSEEIKLQENSESI